MCIRIAAYSGSFRPLHNGHLDVIRRAAALFDELVVIVAANSGKSEIFTIGERIDMVQAAVADSANVRVVPCVGRYAALVAREQGARTLIRGIRNGSDLATEIILANQNRLIAPEMDTLFVPARAEFADASSTLVWQHVGADPEWEAHVARLVPPDVMPYMRRFHLTKRLTKHWASLMRMIGCPAGGEEVFDLLVRRYSEPHRAYHELSHILAMLDEYAGSGMPVDPRLALAIWYHDCIYDTQPGGKSNEERSAEVFEADRVALGVSASDAVTVGKLIMATRHAAPPEGPLEELIIDLDLAILGQEGDAFDRYEAGIRREYAWVPEDVFRRERAKILQSFLDREHIYSMLLMRAKYEVRARENLARSIQQLVS